MRGSVDDTARHGDSDLSAFGLESCGCEPEPTACLARQRSPCGWPRGLLGETTCGPDRVWDFCVCPAEPVAPARISSTNPTLTFEYNRLPTPRAPSWFEIAAGGAVTGVAATFAVPLFVPYYGFDIPHPLSRLGPL
jgi:hypothetical protein